jgi:hypothetical protein
VPAHANWPKSACGRPEPSLAPQTAANAAQRAVNIPAQPTLPSPTTRRMKAAETLALRRHRLKTAVCKHIVDLQNGHVGGPHRRDTAQSPKNRRLRPSDRLRPGLDRRSRHQSAAQRAARHPPGETLVVVWLDRLARSVSHSTRYADSAQPEMPLNWTVSWPGWTHDCLPSCVFRRIPAGNSDGSQPPIPRHSSHPGPAAQFASSRPPTARSLSGDPGERHARPETANASGSRSASPQNVCGHSSHQITAMVGVSRYTAAEYLCRASVLGITWPVPAELDDAALERKLFTPPFAVGEPARP